MTVDILLATFNGEKYLAEQLNSIVNQTYSNWKLLIRDDNSIDNSLEIINKFAKNDKRIHIIKDRLGNLGVSMNFEHILKKSTSAFVMFSDQDDIWFPSKIETTLKEMLLKNQNIPQLIFTNSTVVLESERKIIGNLYNYKVICNLNNFLFLNGGYQGATTMINRNLVEITLPFLNNLPVHDFHISLCGLLFGEVTYLPQSTMYYRKHNSSVTKLNKGFLSKLKSFFEGTPILFNPLIREYLNRFYMFNKEKINEKNAEIIENYNLLTSENTSKIRAINIAYNNKFTVANSVLYLLIKIIFLK